MQVYLYNGGFDLVKSSGIGQALIHQRKALQQAGVQLADHMEQAEIVHINTIFPDSAAAAFKAHLQKKKVVCYAHSTMEDFKGSFKGSNQAAPLFKKWITFCYRQGDVIFTPTEYSKALLQSYGIKTPIYSVSNGIDTEFFAPSQHRRQEFRTRYGIRNDEKVVISVGHTIYRKGILDYIEMARRLPQVKFLWFGYTPEGLVPQEIQRAIASAPENLTFCGYIQQQELRDAYCGADLFAFLSHEETEGIVVLEALATGCAVLLRDIPVYNNWLQHGVQVWKERDLEGFIQRTKLILQGDCPSLQKKALETAEARSLRVVGMQIQEIYQKEGFISSKSKDFCVN